MPDAPLSSLQAPHLAATNKPRSLRAAGFGREKQYVVQTKTKRTITKWQVFSIVRRLLVIAEVPHSAGMYASVGPGDPGACALPSALWMQPMAQVPIALASVLPGNESYERSALNVQISPACLLRGFKTGPNYLLESKKNAFTMAYFSRL
ncbi:hypothetical protein ON010_g92 [Phytophthora cinnamomi]|nr:hypothetical protein ON010_g92 [Phytophthora cinnamomi]